MVDAADTPVLAVLTRAPSSRGKTRLFASLGVPPDPSLLVALLLDTLDCAAVPGVQRVVAVTPASECDAVREIVDDVVGDVNVIAQSEGDLGDRMRATMIGLFARGATAVALIGSDLPHIPASAIAEACALAAKDPDALVLGPATDGGYYLVAAQRVPDIFSGITWGSLGVLSQTERAAAVDRFHVHHLATLADVDTARDLHNAARSGWAPRTAAWLDAYGVRFGRPD